MALMPSKTTEFKLNDLFDKIPTDFYKSIKIELGIEDVHYEIIKDSYKNNYLYPEVKGCCVPNSTKTGVDKVVIFTGSIADYINFKYSRFSNPSMYEDVLIIYLKFVLIHEMVHIKQIKNGMSFEEYFKMDYKTNKYEYEADKTAATILSRDSAFVQEFVKLILDNKGADYDDISKLNKLYLSSNIGGI